MVIFGKGFGSMYSDLVKRLRDAGEDCGTNNIFVEAADAIEGLDGYVKELNIILDIFNERENRKKYLKYWRAKNNKSDLSYPDGDEVYREFFELLERNEDLEMFIAEYKTQVKCLEAENARLRLKMSYMKNSDLFMGDINDETEMEK
jgi:hypothetical protein